MNKDWPTESKKVLIDHKKTNWFLNDSIYFDLLPLSQGLAFMIYMIVDCTKRKFKEDSERVIWILVIVFLSVFGAIIYYYIHGKNEPDDKIQSPRKRR